VEIGLLEKRVDEHNRVYVRLTEKIHEAPERIIFGRQKKI
jgi:DNA-binding MarR family transcriptional regulator